MATNATIRTARAGDLDGLLALYQHLHARDPSVARGRLEQAWARMLADEHLTVFIAESDGALIGSCMLVLTPNLTRGARPFGTIENVVTDPAHRGQGIGKAILRAACNAAWAEDAYKVMLMTGRKDEATLRFYTTAGFSPGKTAFQMRRS